MAVNGSQALELLHKGQENNQVHEAHASIDTVAIFPPVNTPVSTAHGIGISSNPIYHTAFMQCRSCCNCNPQCNYYGKGYFDARGNYVGPRAQQVP